MLTTALYAQKQADEKGDNLTIVHIEKDSVQPKKHFARSKLLAIQRQKKQFRQLMQMKRERAMQQNIYKIKTYRKH